MRSRPIRFAALAALLALLPRPAAAQAPGCRETALLPLAGEFVYPNGSVEVSPDGRFVALWAPLPQGATVELRDGTTGALRQRITARVGCPAQVALSPDGSFVVVGPEEAPGRPCGDVAVLDAATGRERARRGLDDLGIGGFLRYAASRDGASVLVSGPEGAALLDARSLAVRGQAGHRAMAPGSHGLSRVVPGSGGRIAACAFSGDGAARRAEVVVFDLAAGARVGGVAVAHCAELEPSDDGRHVTARDGDWGWVVIDLTTGRAVRRLRGADRARVSGDVVLTVTRVGPEGLTRRLEVRALRGRRLLDLREPIDYDPSRCLTDDPPFVHGADLVFFQYGNQGIRVLVLRRP